MFLFQYLELVEQFKETHRTLEQLKNSGFSTGDIKKVNFLMYQITYNLYLRNIKWFPCLHNLM